MLLPLFSRRVAVSRSSTWLTSSGRHLHPLPVLANRGLSFAAARPRQPQWTPSELGLGWSEVESRKMQGESKRCGIIGMKCGMTQGWTAEGKHVPFTIIEVQDLVVTQVKTTERNGFNALQLGGGWQKRKRLRPSEFMQFDGRGLSLKRYMREFPVSEDALLPIGTSVSAQHFVPGQYVDVQGVTKGKGFAGVMKRWGFKGQPASHGNSLAHRAAGSSGGAAGSLYATRVRPGKKMAGRMGNKRRTVHSMLVYKVNTRHNLIYLKGSVPGKKGDVVRMRDAHWVKNTVELPFPTYLGPTEGEEVQEEIGLERLPEEK